MTNVNLITSPTRLGKWLQQGRQLLAPTPVSLRNRRVRFWFGLTLAYAMLLAVLTWATITEGPYHIPDDARQHVFWMQRFTDSELFTSDWIADYFASVAPIGFVALYRGVSWLGLDPLTFNTILPSLLVVLTAIAVFLVGLELCALPAVGFAASVLLSQSIEYTSSIASGTPKAFVWLLTTLFWYGWLRRSRWLTWGSILLQGAFYPPTVLISAGVLALGLIERTPVGRWRWRRDRQLWFLTVGGLAIATGIVLQYGLSSSEFGPIVTLAEALAMPEFYDGGRGAFFRADIANYLLQGRSGLQLHSAFTPLTNLLGLGLPVLLCFPKRFPLMTTSRTDLGLLWRVIATSLFWFIAAHLVLFRLHLPNRYVGRYLILVFVMAAALALMLIADSLLQWALRALAIPLSAPAWQRSAIVGGASGLALLLFSVLLFYPLTYPNYPTTSLARGQAFALYEFFATQPKDLMLASLSPEANNIPSFTGRSVLVSSETAIPYHQGYYREIERRSRNLIAAQFTTDPAVLQGFIQKYGITHWLLDAYTYDPNFWAGNRWLQQYQPEADQAVLSLRYGQVPVLATLGDRCDRFNRDGYRVLDASCIMAATSN